MVYVGSGSVDGLLVIDVADPQAPSLIETVPGTHAFLDIEGDLLAADNGDGMGHYTLELFDITSPSSPVPLGEVAMPSGARIFVGDSDVPLSILTPTCE